MPSDRDTQLFFTSLLPDTTRMTFMKVVYSSKKVLLMFPSLYQEAVSFGSKWK